VPLMTLHCVGGSSSRTGAKFWDKTCLGSTDGFIGGSTKVLMMSSSVLSISVGIDDVCSVLFVFLSFWVVVMRRARRVFVGVVLSVLGCNV